MANVTAQDVKELRDMTGCGMMDCKRALVEADGNRDEAVKILREMGLARRQAESLPRALSRLRPRAIRVL